MPSSTSSSSDNAPAAVRSNFRSGVALAALLLSLSSALVVAQLLPLQLPVLTGSDRSMQQYDSLRAYAETREHLDWVAIGSSFVRQGVNPKQVDEVLTLRTERHTTGYNFGSGGLAISMLEPMIELAYAGAAPAGSAVAVVVVQPSMLFTSSTVIRERESLVAESPYGRAVLDDVAPRRWIARVLLDHVRLAGLRYRFKAALLGDGEERKSWTQLTPGETRGYVVIDDTWKPPGRGAWKRFLRFLEGGLDPDRAAQVLATALKRARGTHAAGVVLVEGAQHPGAIVRMEKEGFPASLLRTVLVQAAREAHVPLVTLTNVPQFGEREFRDPKHLNEVGATRYSQWLGEALSASSAFTTTERGS